MYAEVREESYSYSDAEEAAAPAPNDFYPPTCGDITCNAAKATFCCLFVMCGILMNDPTAGRNIADDGPWDRYPISGGPRFNPDGTPRATK
jgi:hypothetical protein